MERQGNFVTGFYPEDIRANLDEEVGQFVFPPYDGGYAGQPVLGGGDIAALFNGNDDEAIESCASSPQTRSGQWAAAGGWLSPHATFDVSQYPTRPRGPWPSSPPPRTSSATTARTRCRARWEPGRSGRDGRLDSGSTRSLDPDEDIDGGAGPPDERRRRRGPGGCPGDPAEPSPPPIASGCVPAPRMIKSTCAHQDLDQRLPLVLYGVGGALFFYFLNMHASCCPGGREGLKPYVYMLPASLAITINLLYPAIQTINNSLRTALDRVGRAGQLHARSRLSSDFRRHPVQQPVLAARRAGGHGRLRRGRGGGGRQAPARAPRRSASR